jgi:hypothetical protein
MVSEKLDKTILIDCDGVLVDWCSGFELFMTDLCHFKSHVSYDICDAYAISSELAFELCERFNASAQIGFLPPLDDAVHYVRKLHDEHGYDFHVITSLTANPWSQILRKRSLLEKFGEVFSNMTFLPCGEHKRNVLERYASPDRFWIEDKVENALDGYELGLKTILFTQEYNEKFEHSGIARCHTWKEIYEKITT